MKQALPVHCGACGMCVSVGAGGGGEHSGNGRKKPVMQAAAGEH